MWTLASRVEAVLGSTPEMKPEEAVLHSQIKLTNQDFLKQRIFFLSWPTDGYTSNLKTGFKILY